jgi:hypothetical protein
MEAIGEGRNSAVALPPWDGGAGRLPRGLGDVVWAGVSTGIFAVSLEVEEEGGYFCTFFLTSASIVW